MSSIREIIVNMYGRSQIHSNLNFNTKQKSRYRRRKRKKET